MAELYYIRWKSQVSGPFSEDDVRNMLSAGRLSKHHQVSGDQSNWMALYDSESFRSCCAAVPPVPAQPIVRPVSHSIRIESKREDEAPPQRVQERPRLQFRDDGGDLASDRWYYVSDGETAGPVGVPELRALVDADTLKPQGPICREGEEHWQKAEEVFPDLWRKRQRKASTPGMEMGEYAQELTYAGFWLRTCACLIDTILLQVIVNGAIMWVLMSMFGLSITADNLADEALSLAGLVATATTIFVSWMYFASSESSTAQASLGKRAMGPYVPDIGGSRITFGQATGRYFGKILSGLFFGIGYLMAAFTEKKQALHDMMAATVVLRR